MNSVCVVLHIYVSDCCGTFLLYINAVAGEFVCHIVIMLHTGG